MKTLLRVKDVSHFVKKKKKSIKLTLKIAEAMRQYFCIMDHAREVTLTAQFPCLHAQTSQTCL